MNKAHISIHESLLEEFKTIFSQFDTEESGVLTLAEATEFVNAFFKPKIEKMVVGADIPDKIIKKLDQFKRNRIIFS